MSCQDNLKFLGISHYQNNNFMNMVEFNLKARLDWGFLNIGAWTDVDNSGLDQSKLIMCQDCRDVGTVWQSARKEWVYESGVTYTDPTGGIYNPVFPSVYIDGVLQTSGYSINYPAGEIKFDSVQSESSNVRAFYSIRNIHVEIGNLSPWWQELQYNSWNFENFVLSNPDYGEWSINDIHRIQLPVIIIDSVPQGTSQGYDLGRHATRRMQNVVFHVIAEDKITRNNIVDTLLRQAHHGICSFDIDQATYSGSLPLNCDGDIDPSGLSYPELVATYPWYDIMWFGGNIVHAKTHKPNLHEAMVMFEIEVILND